MHVFEIYQGMDQKFYWRCRRNRRIVADGSEGYATRANARRAIRRLPLGPIGLKWTIMYK